MIFPIVGTFAARRATGSESDYLLGGRSFGSLVVGLSAGAAAVSGFIMVAVVGMGYSLGISALFIPLSYFLGDILFWTFFPARLNRTARSLDCYTVPELLSSGVTGHSVSHIRSAAAIITIVFVGIYASAQLLAASKTLGGTFQLDRTTGSVIAAVVILSYCAKGGLRASVWNNFVQANIMMLTAFGMLIAALIVGGGPQHIIDSLTALDPELLNIWTGFAQGPLVFAVVGFAGAAFGFNLSAPQFIVRLVAGRSPDEVARAKWIYIFFMQFMWICMTLFGVIMRVVLPDIDDPEQALPLFARTTLDPWLVGAVMAGVFSAIVSTLDAQLLVISSAVAVDVAPNLHQRLTERFGENYRIMTTVVVAIVLVLIAVSVESTMFTLVFFAGSALTGAFAPALIVVILHWRTNATAIKVCMLTGLTVAIAWRATGLSAYMIEGLPGLMAGLLAHAGVIGLTRE